MEAIFGNAIEYPFIMDFPSIMMTPALFVRHFRKVILFFLDSCPLMILGTMKKSTYHFAT